MLRFVSDFCQTLRRHYDCAHADNVPKDLRISSLLDKKLRKWPESIHKVR